MEVEDWACATVPHRWQCQWMQNGTTNNPATFVTTYKTYEILTDV